MIERLDHLVLTVADLQRTIDFYVGLGMGHETFEDGRHALTYGRAKINLHQADHTFEPKAAFATPGSADLCFIASGRIEDVAARLAQRSVPILEGPVARTGALGPMESYYVRDPDGNLIEISVYPQS